MVFSNKLCAKNLNFKKFIGEISTIIVVQFKIIVKIRSKSKIIWCIQTNKQIDSSKMIDYVRTLSLNLEYIAEANEKIYNYTMNKDQCPSTPS